MKIYRHGDLLLVEVKEIPTGLEQKKDDVLLEGEASNHFHRIKGAVITPVSEAPTILNDYLMGYLEIDKEGILTHEEHETIIVPRGKYKYLSQREYDPQEERRVID